jgi:hypothetical protein
MRLIARLLAPLTCAAALAVVPAAPAHAGCADDLIAALKQPPILFNLDPDRYIEVVGGDVIVHSGNITGDALSIVFFVEGRALTLVFATPAALLTFLNCVKA